MQADADCTDKFKEVLNKSFCYFTAQGETETVAKFDVTKVNTKEQCKIGKHHHSALIGDFIR